MILIILCQHEVPQPLSTYCRNVRISNNPLPLHLIFLHNLSLGDQTKSLSAPRLLFLHLHSSIYLLTYYRTPVPLLLMPVARQQAMRCQAMRRHNASSGGNLMRRQEAMRRQGMRRHNQSSRGNAPSRRNASPGNVSSQCVVRG